jgi:glycosyltransferase involved in cell wall biosynthesis
MNILLINHYAGSPHHGMEFRPYYLAREWQRMGHRVQILAGSYSHIRGSQPPEGRGRCWSERIDGVAYRWYRTPTYRGNGVRRVFSMVVFITQVWRAAPKLARDFKPDVVIASSTYPMDIWPARRVARAAHARLVYEVHDLWPLSPMELRGMSRWHPFILWVQCAEDYAYRHVDKVVSLLPKASPYMQSRGMAADKFACVPNGVDPDEWDHPAPLPEAAAAAVAAARAIGLPIVGYVGTHGLANALDVLLDAARLLQGAAQILMVGPGPDRDRLAARVRDESLSNVTMLPSVPKASVPSLLEHVDVAYIGWHPNPLYRFGISPNKLLDYMMAGKPIVHSVSAGNDLVADARCGLTVAPGDPGAAAGAIRQLISLTADERMRMGASGRDYVLRNQTYPVLAKRFLETVSG